MELRLVFIFGYKFKFQIVLKFLLALPSENPTSIISFGFSISSRTQNIILSYCHNLSITYINTHKGVFITCLKDSTESSQKVICLYYWESVNNQFNIQCELSRETTLVFSVLVRALNLSVEFEWQAPCY